MVVTANNRNITSTMNRCCKSNGITSYEINSLQYTDLMTKAEFYTHNIQKMYAVSIGDITLYLLVSDRPINSHLI